MKNRLFIFIIAAFIFSSVFFIVGDSALAAGERNYILPRCGQPGDTSDNKIMSERYGLNDFLWLIVLIMRWLFSILGSVALLMVVWGGFLWLISAGSQERVKEGQTTLTNAVWGIGIILGSWLLVNFIVAGLTGFKGTGAAEIFDRVAWNNFAIQHCLGTGASNTGSSGGKSGTTARPAAPTSGAAAPRSSSPAAPATPECTAASRKDCSVCVEGRWKGCEDINKYCQTSSKECKPKKPIPEDCTDDGDKACQSGKCVGGKCAPRLGSIGNCHIVVYHRVEICGVSVFGLLQNCGFRSDQSFYQGVNKKFTRTGCKEVTLADLGIEEKTEEFKASLITLGTGGQKTIDTRSVTSRLLCPEQVFLITDSVLGTLSGNNRSTCEAP